MRRITGGMFAPAAFMLAITRASIVSSSPLLSSIKSRMCAILEPETEAQRNQNSRPGWQRHLIVDSTVDEFATAVTA
jgi:hypothetical protein